MNDSVAMRIVECARDFTGETHHLLDRKLTLAVQSPAQRFSLHEGHYIVKLAVGLSRIEQRDHNTVAGDTSHVSA